MGGYRLGTNYTKFTCDYRNFLSRSSYRPLGFIAVTTYCLNSFGFCKLFCVPYTSVNLKPPCILPVHLCLGRLGLFVFGFYFAVCPISHCDLHTHSGK